MKSFVRYAVILTLLITLFIAGTAFADTVEPPDSAPEGCWTQDTQMWPDGSAIILWSLGHFNTETALFFFKDYHPFCRENFPHDGKEDMTEDELRVE